MKLLRGFQNNGELKSGAVATIGNFDGVHLGHQALLAQLRQEANKLRLPMVVVLFEPQPSEFFQKLQAPARLTRLREKLDILKQCGVDYVCCLKFDKKLAAMPASVFAEQLFSRLHVRYLLMGNDFRFGHNRTGDFGLLKEIGEQWSCAVHVWADFVIDKERVSSTKIRQILQEDGLAKVEQYLGRTYSMCGRVTHGAALGRQWGVPTANLKMKQARLPLKGIFCVHVKRNNSTVLLQGVANLGNRPTIDGNKNILEIHLFDFDELIYGEQLQVFFLHKLRDEIKFSSIDVLIAQIHSDVANAKTYFMNINE